MKAVIENNTRGPPPVVKAPDPGRCRCESYRYWYLRTKAETAAERYGAAVFWILPLLALLAVTAVW